MLLPQGLSNFVSNGVKDTRVLVSRVGFVSGNGFRIGCEVVECLPDLENSMNASIQKSSKMKRELNLSSSPIKDPYAAGG